MSFGFNKETRRSLRERIRDGINLIPGASVVQNQSILGGGPGAPGNGATHVPKTPPVMGSSPSKKSHSVECTLSTSEEMMSLQPPPSPSLLVAPDEDHANAASRSGSVSSCSSSSSSPSKYRTYVVKDQDTVTSIAASFDCTPSELMRVNRLITARVLFPGQVLKIPNKKSPTSGGPQPGPVCAPPAQPAHDAKTSEMLESITYAQRKFLKIKVKHVTDGNGVVNGTLLITPNAVMFDPNVSDPLVIEQGAETYGIIVPIEYIVGASIWSDLCNMKVRGKDSFVAPGPRPLLWSPDPPVTASGSDTPAVQNKLEEVADHPLKEESILVWYFCLTIGRPKEPTESVSQVRRRRTPFCVTYGQKNTVRPEFWFSVSTEQVPELYKYWMFWWPTIYGELDVQLINERGYEVIDWDNLDVTERERKVAETDDACEEQTVAQELNELTKESWEMLKQPYAKLSSFISTRGSSIMKSSSHSSQSSVSEHVGVAGGVSGGGGGHGPSGGSLFNSATFSITNPMNSFFFESFSNISPNHSVFDDTDDDDDEFGSFEQVVTNEELRNLLAIGGDEMMAINLPDLIGGKSDILEDEDIRNLTRHLTARAEGYPWTLIFTSSRDGFSLNSLYRRNSLMPEDSPVLLIVQDTNSRVFGALVSCSLHTSDSFYGTGQSFLFTLRPEFNVYKWTGENLFFVKGNHDGIWIGAGDGKFGLYVDGDLNCGRTESCQTYGNAPLTEPQDFIIKTLELWSFGNYTLSGDVIEQRGGSDK